MIKNKCKNKENKFIQLSLNNFFCDLSKLICIYLLFYLLIYLLFYLSVLKTRFDNILLKSEFIHNEVSISFNIDNATNSLIIHVTGGWELKIEGFFDTFLKFIKSLYVGGDKNIIKYSKECIKIIGDEDFFASCVLTRNKINYINELFIYTNIIENQHVGSDMVKLLKVVNVIYIILPIHVDMLHSTRFLMNNIGMYFERNKDTFLLGF